jgi:hypothetical protein
MNLDSGQLKRLRESFQSILDIIRADQDDVVTKHSEKLASSVIREFIASESSLGVYLVSSMAALNV